MRRLALLMLLASSSVVAAPAPLPKTQRKAERPAAQQFGASVLHSTDDVVLVGFNLAAQPALAFQPPPPLPVQAPAQPRNADPPG